jgi:pimeloyl-ACP methyl ester carboxylesterase
VAAYDLDVLAADILGLANHFGAARFSIIGHDWGASVGWWLATFSSERLERLVLMNAPPPVVWREAMSDHLEQRRRSLYAPFCASACRPAAAFA